MGSLERFCDPKTPEELIRVLGTAHGEYLRERVERQRRGVPNGQPDGNRRCWGNMVWRLNDSWPIIYWSVIDYYLEPKIPFYYLRRSYDPILVTFERTADEIFVWVVNDSPDSVEGTLTVNRRSFKGDSRGKLEARVEVAPGEAKRCLSCGNCFECDGCYGACPQDAIIKLGPGKRYKFDFDKCTGCAVCYEQCPCHAIEMIDEPATAEAQT